MNHDSWHLKAASILVIIAVSVAAALRINDQRFEFRHGDTAWSA
jgi:hypothetical protein